MGLPFVWHGERRSVPHFYSEGLHLEAGIAEL